MWTDWSDQYEEVSSVSMIFLTSFKYPLNNVLNVENSFEIFLFKNFLLSKTSEYTSDWLPIILNPSALELGQSENLKNLKPFCSK